MPHKDWQNSSDDPMVEAMAERAARQGYDPDNPSHVMNLFSPQAWEEQMGMTGEQENQPGFFGQLWEKYKEGAGQVHGAIGDAFSGEGRQDMPWGRNRGPGVDVNVPVPEVSARGFGDERGPGVSLTFPEDPYAIQEKEFVPGNPELPPQAHVDLTQGGQGQQAPQQGMDLSRQQPGLMQSQAWEKNMPQQGGQQGGEQDKKNAAMDAALALMGQALQPPQQNAPPPPASVGNAPQIQTQNQTALNRRTVGGLF